MRACLLTVAGALAALVLSVPGSALATKPDVPLELRLTVAGSSSTEVVTDVGAVVDLKAVARPLAEGATLEFRVELSEGLGLRRGVLGQATKAAPGQDVTFEAGVALEQARSSAVTVVAELVFPDGSRLGTARRVELRPPGLAKASPPIERVVHPAGGGALVEHEAVER